MKAEIINGCLNLIPESETENYALEKWFDNHADGCSFIMDLRKDIKFVSYKKPKITLFKRIKVRIQLFFYR